MDFDTMFRFVIRLELIKQYKVGGEQNYSVDI